MGLHVVAPLEHGRGARAIRRAIRGAILGTILGAILIHRSPPPQARQLSLSPHFPAFLGHEPTPKDDPGHACWFIEEAAGPTLAQLVASRGPLTEASLLFGHWRRQILAALLHLSAQCTFMVPHAITLDHVRVAEDGGRLVLDGLDFGAEAPPPELTSPEEAAEAHAARDAALFSDGVRMILALVGDAESGAEGAAGPRFVGPELSRQLAAVKAIGVGVGGVRSGVTPTLQQALSHPYFRPLPGFELDDVQAAYKALVQGDAEGA